MGAPMSEPQLELFVYGTLMRREPEHNLLAGAEFLGTVQTEASCVLVNLGVYPALVVGGAVSVFGELFRVDLKTLARIDVRHEVPVLFERARVRLLDGRTVETHAMDPDKVRGRRRLRHGDWRKRYL